MSASPHMLAVIPVREGARRLPGKPLADLGGRPLVQWVYEAVSRSRAFDNVIVATDSSRIAEAARAFGAPVELTRPEHSSGTDRVAEVAERHEEADVIVNVQGDQPFVTVAMLRVLVSPYAAGESPPMTTLACPLRDAAAWDDTNIVKVVCDRRDDALYFSRSPIPHREEDEVVDGLHHLGLYAFTRETVLRLSALEQGPLEVRERLEQLRALEHGIGVRVLKVDRPVLEVNTAEDLEGARMLLRDQVVSR